MVSEEKIDVEKLCKALDRLSLTGTIELSKALSKELNIELYKLFVAISNVFNKYCVKKR